MIEDRCPWRCLSAARGQGQKAIAELHGPGEVEVLVDNEIAVQNLTKMAQQKGYLSSSEKLAEQEYRVRFTIKDAPAAGNRCAGQGETAGRSGNLHPGCPHRYSGGHRVRQDGGRGPRSWARPCSRPSCSL